MAIKIHNVQEDAGSLQIWVPKLVGRVEDAVIEVAVLRGEGVEHFHSAYNEALFVLRGKLSVISAGKVYDAEPLYLVIIEAGTAHRLRAASETTVLIVESAAEIRKTSR